DGAVEFTAKYERGKFRGQTRQFRNGRLSFSPGGKPKTLEGEWLGKDERGEETIYRLTAVWVPNSGIAINTQLIEEINNASRSDRTSGYKSPYWGKQIGSLDGIPVYYNARDEGNNNRRNKLEDSNGKVIYDFGLKWQCVEFIRRYFYYKHGFLFEGRGDAHSYFSDEVKDGGNHRGLRQYVNDHGYDRRVGKFTGKGSVSKPQKGDLIVMHYSTTGHVAIIGEVSDDSITIVQQNVETDVTERFPLEKVFVGGETRWRINSTRVRGWLRP
ncbi:CHAP domain-containing protein, partial [Calidithermus roseus]|uniref:CHAP domain-containing protein n=1 Tax=Calidithermus roseus TaxID=1644118 RepID=UPI000E64C41C